MRAFLYWQALRVQCTAAVSDMPASLRKIVGAFQAVRVSRMASQLREREAVQYP